MSVIKEDSAYGFAGFGRFATDIKAFNESSCICVCTIDGVRDVNVNKLFIEKHNLPESDEEEITESFRNVASMTWMRDKKIFESLGLGPGLVYETRVDTSNVAITVINGVVIVYKRHNVIAYLRAIELHSLFSSSKFKLLELLTKWDNKRPVLEELLIMGLFGDFEPCGSGYFSLDLKSDSDKKIKQLRKRSEQIFEVFSQAYYLYISTF
jgi:hypothetical protein